MTRIPLYYTFGNHMHWVDMEWLWGYEVLPNSIHDMLYFCRETGAKGNINFDGIGYEKLAVEAPEALLELRDAITNGQIEIVGASYGQPYGLFHGSESNIRQRVYGVRTVMRVLGVRPRTFWEEEFDFFPQLPQMLRGVGYEYASLFYQWTWHTPEIPKETLPAIWWEGHDGSQLLAAPRSPLNLHQWPEDFAGLLDNPLLQDMPVPGIVQWLELMPSPDWMCRAELLLPRLKELIDDPRFELRFATLSDYLEAARDHAEVRRYTMDDVFHGMSLGKNGDFMRRQSRRAEQQLLAAESLSSLMGLFGRPYPHWDVYPTWELEEAWRELQAAQHHDNDECEGLCGHVGKLSYERSQSLSNLVVKRAMQTLADRTEGLENRYVVYNPLGWERSAVVELDDRTARVDSLPPYGYKVIDRDDTSTLPDDVSIVETDKIVTLQHGHLTVEVDKSRGGISQIASTQFPDGILDTPFLLFEMHRNGELDRFEEVQVTVQGQTIQVQRWSKAGKCLVIHISLDPIRDAVSVHIEGIIPRPDTGVHKSLQTRIAVSFNDARLYHDHPYGVSEIRAQGKKYLRKYPTGDWMTSAQVFEEVYNPFTALSLLDFDDGERGLLYVHDGSQAFFREGDERCLSVRNILSMYDAWDEDYFFDELNARIWLMPHGKITHADRWKFAQEFNRPPLIAKSEKAGGNLPKELASVWCSSPDVCVTAFYRETKQAGVGLPDYAGQYINIPHILRLVEFNGNNGAVTVRVPGPVVSVFKTNLLGEIIESVQVTQAGEWSEFIVRMRAYEIATFYIDLEYGRKVPRNLDEHRHIWATVHRVTD